MGYIQDLNIYDLYRTQYGNSGLKRMQRMMHRIKLREDPVGDQIDPMAAYLRRDDVRAAMNIPSYVQQFQDCNNPMYGTYQAFREGSIWIYNILKGYPDLYRLLHYSGDTDGAVATLGTRRWIQQQGWSVTNEWRPWTTDGGLSGYLEDYGTFTFATIHGVGHMAPQWKRKDVTELVNKYVHNEKIN